jgi:hypothetical protein
MAHINKEIVTVCVNGQALRGYNHSKVANKVREDLYMPFDSEYSVRFKFQDSQRRRLEMWIDGTQITDGLILQGQAELERFVESARRFKFVAASNSAVSDPDSPDNGNIVIKLYRERDSMSNPCREINLGGGSGGGYLGPAWVSGIGGQCGGTAPAPQTTYGYASDRMTLSCAAAPAAAPMINSVLRSRTSDVGATVEGRKSSQKFGSSAWMGDQMGSPSVFQFKLHGKTIQRENALSEIERLQQELNRLKATL